MLDPTESGWLAKYLELRPENTTAKVPEDIDNPEKYFYAYLHDSGIMFGHPIKMPVEMELPLLDWPVKERMKLVFAEAFIAAQKIFLPETENFASEKIVQRILDFYTLYRPELLKSSILDFRKKNDVFGKTETVFDRRIIVRGQWNASFWRGFFHNSLLFVDLIHFIDFLQSGEKNIPPATQIRMDILKLIAISVAADQKEAKTETNLFAFFMESARLNKEERKRAAKYTGEDLSLNDLQINRQESWLKRKYFLETAILTLWADRKISPKEEAFLLKLAGHLGFDEEERDSSILSVQSFVMNNWERVHYLQEKQNFFILRKRLTERMAKVAKKYTREIGKEISESKELIELLKIANTRDLSVSEKEAVRQQLYDILKSIPAFVIFMLPFSFLTIPVLLKIIPKSAFPSSFDPNKLNVKKRGNRTIEG